LFHTTISPWLILSAGVLASVSQLRELESVRRHTALWWGLLVVPAVIGAATQLLQYTNVSAAGNEARAEEDRRFAYLLYAFMEPTTPLLEKVTSDPRFLEYKYYSLGYQAFRNKQWDDAKVFFGQAHDSDQFVAESNYLIAYMKTHDQDGCLLRDADWAGAGKLLDDAIRSDPAYTGAHYLRAIKRVNADDRAGALDDLRRAVDGSWGIAECYDVNDSHEIETLWSSLRDDPEFTALARKCFDLANLFKKGSSSVSQSCWQKSHAAGKPTSSSGVPSPRG
jgi:hypothetical protein